MDFGTLVLFVPRRECLLSLTPSISVRCSVDVLETPQDSVFFTSHNSLPVGVTGTSVVPAKDLLD